MAPGGLKRQQYILWAQHPPLSVKEAPPPKWGHGYRNEQLTTSPLTLQPAALHWQRCIFFTWWGAMHRLKITGRPEGFLSSFQTHSWHLRWKAQVWLYHELPFFFSFYPHLKPDSFKAPLLQTRGMSRKCYKFLEECNVIASAKYNLTLEWPVPITLVSLSVLPSQEVRARWNHGEFPHSPFPSSLLVNQNVFTFFPVYRTGY